jgi:predicted double-glycine peptidase
VSNERLNPYIPNKGIYLPENIKGIYKYQEKQFRINCVVYPSKYRAKKARFLTSPEGIKFQECKTSQFSTLHGLKLFYVDGDVITKGLKAGDVDFTMGGHGFRYLYIPFDEIWIDHRYSANPWSTIWHEFTERSLMGRGLPYADAHEQASNLEVILLEGKIFELPVGTYRQSRPGMCGPAAIKIYTDFLNMSTLKSPIGEERITSKYKVSGERGASPVGMLKMAKRLGFNAYEKQNFTEEEVKATIKSGYPIIVNYQADPQPGEGHYSVLFGYSDTDFYLSDPSEDEGYVVTRIDEFMAKWYELEDKTKRQGIVISLK